MQTELPALSSSTPDEKINNAFAGMMTDVAQSSRYSVFPAA